MQKISDDLNVGQNSDVTDNKTVRNFKCPKILRYRITTLESGNKPDVIRKGLEMAGTVEAVTKELEPEGSFKNSSRRLLSHFELHSR